MESSETPLKYTLWDYRGVKGSKKKKPCCACKLTKFQRDNCIMNNEESVCLDFVRAHKLCLQAKGFKIE